MNLVLLLDDDHLREIERDPAFGRKVAAAVRKLGGRVETKVPIEVDGLVVGSIIAAIPSDMTALMCVGQDINQVLCVLPNNKGELEMFSLLLQQTVKIVNNIDQEAA